MYLIRYFRIITALFLLCNLCFQTSAQNAWHKYPGNPVFEPGKNGDWDQNIIDFAVIYDDAQYHLWYSAWAKDALGHSAFGYASSKDGIHWTKYEGNPLIFDCNGTPWDEKYWTFDVIRKDSLYLMWYTAESKDEAKSANIGFAWSQDGLHWTKHAEPVIQPGDGDSWEASGIGGPCVLYKDGRYHMWYNGVPDRMPKVVSIGYATSEDGIHWEKCNKNPVFDAGEPGSFDDQWVVVNDVNYNGSEFEMWYFGWNCIQFEIGTAISSDGVRWERSPGNPVLTTGDIGSWDAQMIAVANVITFDSISRMFFFGSDNTKSQLGYAVTSSPEAGSWDTARIVYQQRKVRVQLFNRQEFIKVDSLIRVIPGLTGKDLIDACNKIALAYSLNNDAKSYQYAIKARELAQKENYAKGKAMALYSMGNSEYVMDNYAEALGNQLKALWIFDSLDMKSEAGNLLMQIASIHSFAGSHDLACNYNQQAMEAFEELSDTSAILQALKQLGNSLLQSGDTNRALKIFDQRLILSHTSGDLLSVAETYEALGVGHKQEIDTSLYYFAEALSIWDTLDWSQRGMIYLKMAESCFASGPTHYKESEEYFLKSYDILLASIGAGQDQLRLCLGMAELYLTTGRHDEAKEYLRLSLDMCRTFLSKHDHQMYVSLNNKLQYGIFLKIYMEKIYRLYYQLDTTLNNKDSALQHFILATAWKDSVYNEQSWRKVAVIQGNYEIESSRNMITILEKQNEVKSLTIRQSRIYLFALGGFVTVIILMGLLFIRQNRIRAEHRSVLLEQKLLRLQMNPHFIFNALSGILNFISRKEMDKATGYLTSFSHLLRSTLQGSREEYIHLEEEIVSLRNYLDLQSLRYADKFEYSIEVDELIDKDNAIIPPMLLQPFVENAIEHGINHKKDKGHINVRFRMNNKKLVCEIEDDGIGREKASQVNYSVRSTHKSLATQIILDRIQVLNKKSKQKISLKIHDLKTEDGLPAGTKVVLELPYLTD